MIVNLKYFCLCKQIIRHRRLQSSRPCRTLELDRASLRSCTPRRSSQTCTAHRERERHLSTPIDHLSPRDQPAVCTSWDHINKSAVEHRTHGLVRKSLLKLVKSMLNIITNIRDSPHRRPVLRRDLLELDVYALHIIPPLPLLLSSPHHSTYL